MTTVTLLCSLLMVMNTEKRMTKLVTGAQFSFSALIVQWRQPVSVRNVEGGYHSIGSSFLCGVSDSLLLDCIMKNRFF